MLIPEPKKDRKTFDFAFAHNAFTNKLSIITAEFLYDYLTACLTNSFYRGTGISDVQEALRNGEGTLINEKLVTLFVEIARNDGAYINRLAGINLLKLTKMKNPSLIKAHHIDTLKNIRVNDNNHHVREHAEKVIGEVFYSNLFVPAPQEPTPGIFGPLDSMPWSDGGRFCQQLEKNAHNAFTFPQFWPLNVFHDIKDEFQYSKGEENRLNTAVNDSELFWNDLKSNTARLTPDSLSLFAVIALKCENDTIRINSIRGITDLILDNNLLGKELLKTLGRTVKLDPSYEVRSVGLHFFLDYVLNCPEDDLTFVADTMRITAKNIARRAMAQHDSWRSLSEEERTNCHDALAIMRSAHKRDPSLGNDNSLECCLGIAATYEGAAARREAIQLIGDLVDSDAEMIDDPLRLFLAECASKEENPFVLFHINQLLNHIGPLSDTEEPPTSDEVGTYGVTTGKALPIQPDGKNCIRPQPHPSVTHLQQGKHL